MTDGIMVTMVRTDRLGESLYVPVDGVLQVFTEPIDPLRYLGEVGRYARLHVGRDGMVHFRVHEGVPLNLRASMVLAALADVHMVFTGNVVFTGLPGDRVFHIISQLSSPQEGTHE